MPTLISDEIGPRPLNDGDLAHLAEINATRQMADTLGRMARVMQDQTSKLEQLGEKVGAMHTDIEVMKVRDERTKELNDEVRTLKGRVDAIEILHAQQAGAGKAATMLKDFSPWIFGILAAAIAIAERLH